MLNGEFMTPFYASTTCVDLKVSSQFDRRLFQSRVHSIKTKGQIGRSKGFDRKVNDKNCDSMHI